MEISEAVHALDQANPEHWTSDGAPRVDAVSEILGREVSRAAIDAAVPDFRRGAVTDPRDASGQGTEQDPEAGESGSSKPPETDPSSASMADPSPSNASESPPETGAENAGPEGQSEHEAAGYAVKGADELVGPADPKARRAWLERLMADIDGGLRRGQELLRAAAAEYAELAKEDPPPTPQERFRADRRHYHETQALLREERGRRLKLLRESDVDLKALRGVMAPSQLDAALARKRERGGRRPEFFPGASPTKDPGAGK